MILELQDTKTKEQKVKISVCRQTNIKSDRFYI